MSDTAERSTARAPGILARLVGGTSWAYLAAALCLWAFLRVAGDRSWFGTLALFGPRWLALTPLLILAPCALRLRRKALVALAGGAGIILFPVMGVCVPRTAGESEIPGPTLRIMTCNVHRSALDVSAFARVVAEVRPDVIAVQEWTSAHGTAFLGEGQWFTQRDGELCLFSRFPIRQVEDVAARAWAARREPGAAVVYELAAPPGPVPLVNLHLASPHKAFDAVLHWTGDGPEMIDRNVALRRRQSQEIRRAIERFGGARALLAGDFNTPGESDIFRESWSRYADAFAIAGAGLGDTYYARWTRVRIDHVLAGAGWRCRRAEVGPDVGSPHRPLIVELEWAGLIQR